MITHPSKVNTYTTNVVEFNANDNAYDFNQGFCIMHQSNESKVEFQIVQQVQFEKSQLLSLSFNVSDKDLTLIPTQSSPSWGSVHKKGEQAVASMLVPISDVSKHSNLILNTFRPYINSDINAKVNDIKIDTHNIKKTCVYLRNAQMIKEMDILSQNDAFIKIIPDFDDKRSIRSAVINNRNNATWNEQICFDGVVQEIEFHIYDVDDIGIGISEKHIGSGNIQINPQKQHSDLRIRLGDISNHYVGTLLIDIFYIYKKSASIFGLINDYENVDTEIKKTCVGIIRGSFYVNTDRFSKNDAFIKIIPDFQSNEAMNTKTIKNTNNPKWGQVLCFKSSIDNFEFHLFDADNNIISKDETQIGSTMYGLDGKEHENVELHLYNDIAQDIGSLFINIFYVYGRKQITTTFSPTSSKPTTSKPTKSMLTIKPSVNSIKKPSKKISPTTKPALKPTTPSVKKLAKPTKKPVSNKPNTSNEPQSSKNKKASKPISKLIPTKQPTKQVSESSNISNEQPLNQETPNDQGAKLHQTCINVLSGKLTKDADTFTENDCFVKITPDLNEQHAAQTSVMRNTANPSWQETLCFDGQVSEISFDVYDVDKYLKTSYSHLGSAKIIVKENIENSLELKLIDNVGAPSGTLIVDIYYTFIPTLKPTINIMDDEYMSTLSLYSDGYLLLGNGKCRDSEQQSPLYYFAKLDPFQSNGMDDPHGLCRKYCNLDDDCLGYVYHISGLWKYYCALYVSVDIGDDSPLQSVINKPQWKSTSNGDIEINQLSKVEPFDNNDVHHFNDKTLGFCFVKTRSPPPIILDTCININGFDPLVMNPPIINSAPITALSKPVSETVSVTLKDGKGQVCWNHDIKGFQLQFSSTSTGWFSSSNTSPIGHTKVEFDESKTKLKQKSTVLSNTDTMIYDMNYDLMINADHYGCCYEINYQKGEAITYNKLMNLKLSQCVIDETKTVSTIFSYNVQCNQLKSVVISSSIDFIYIGDGGCRDEDNLAPSRYWHDKLEFHSCQLQCIQDNTCLGIMYFHQGRWKGRCLIYTSSLSLLQLYQDGNVIPHNGWKWIEADPSPKFDLTQRKVVQTMGSVASGRCFAKNVISFGDSGNTVHSVDNEQFDSETDGDYSDELTVRISDVSHQDALGLPWPNQPGIFEMMYNRGNTLNKVCILGQLQKSSFPSIDGEYILMNRRVTHNGKSVWYNKLTGYYLYWNIVENELQVFDDIIDDDYFASLEKNKYWKLNMGEQDSYDQFIRLIPHACPESTCIQIDGVVSSFPLNVDKAWIEINSIKQYVVTNKTNAKHNISPVWNQRFCFKPSPIALLQLIASDLYIPSDQDGDTIIKETVLGKFHISPLTEGVLIRPIHASELVKNLMIDTPILTQIDVELNDWDGKGLYDPSEYALRSIRSSTSSINDITGSSSLRIESDRGKWIGYIGQKMTMIIHAFGTMENNVDWSLINPGLFDIKIDNIILPDSASNSVKSISENDRNLTELMSHAMSQWTISRSGFSSNSDEDEYKLSSAIMLTGIPKKKMNYQIVIVAYEKDGDESASIEIEVQVLKPPKTKRSTTRSPKFEIGSDEFANIWNGQEHGKNMWIIWCVLATIIITLSAVIIMFIRMRKQYLETTSSDKSSSNNSNNNNAPSTIEMNKINYHSVKKHTIKPIAQSATECQPGNIAEEEILNA